MLFALRLLRESLDLYTAVLLWQNDAGTHLRISELASDAPNLSEGPFLSGDGVFGAAITQRAPVVLGGLKPGYKLPTTSAPPRCAPCARCRCSSTASSAACSSSIASRTGRSRRASSSSSTRRAATPCGPSRTSACSCSSSAPKVEQGKLYRAAEDSAPPRPRRGVIEAGVNERPRDRRPSISRPSRCTTRRRRSTRSAPSAATGSDELTGQRFKPQRGARSRWWSQNRHPLPYRGEYDDKRQVVFTRRVAPPVDAVDHRAPARRARAAARHAGARFAAARGLQRLGAHRRSRSSPATWPCRSPTRAWCGASRRSATMDGLDRAVQQARDARGGGPEDHRGAAASRSGSRCSVTRHRSLQEGERHVRPRRGRRRSSRASATSSGA